MKRGLSNLIAFVLVILMTLTVATAFYYWFTGVHSDAMSASETFTGDIQSQVITQSTSLIDQYYKTDNEKNMNNFGEITQTICAEDKGISLSEDDISFELYEGYGSNQELICSEFGVDCKCDQLNTAIVGVLGGNNTQNGITLISSTDGENWTEKVVTTDFGNYDEFDFSSISTFVEGGNNCTSPINIILHGSARLDVDGGLGEIPDNKPKYIGLVVNSSLDGVSYDTAGVDLENVTKYFDITQSPLESDDTLEHLFKGGTLFSPTLGTNLEAIITHQFSIYDRQTRLPAFGTNGRSISNSAVTAIQRIIRNGENQLLIGVTLNDSSGGSYIDETIDIASGMEKNYPSECPYEVTSFDACGYDPTQAAACTIQIDQVADIFYADQFDAMVSLENSKPVFIGVRGRDKAGRGVNSLLYTGYNMTETVIYCLDLNAFGAGYDYRLNVTDIKYFDNLGTVAAFITSEEGIAKTQVIMIRQEGENLVPVLTDIPTTVSIKTFAQMGDYLYGGGTDYSDGLIFRYKLDEEGTIIDITQVYQNTDYLEVQKLETIKYCADRNVYCVDGCNKVLKRGECSDLTLSLENSDCDISKYSYETDFTSRLNVGNDLQILNVFTKKQKSSKEINSTLI